ncbi:hypothetical protein E2320_000166 [Naja naja]|nr:hypothetical protein E2320_000166 [Naja naja]
MLKEALDEAVASEQSEEIQTEKSNSLKTARRATTVHHEETEDRGSHTSKHRERQFEPSTQREAEPTKRKEQGRGLFHCPHKPMTRGNNKPPIWKHSKQENTCDC